MKKILILLSHPIYEKSRVNLALINHIKSKEHVTIRDLYECYPDFLIDVPAEKKLLEQHDIIIWHYPMYWYSCPPLMKQWIDDVLEFKWAYGPKGSALKYKTCLNAITVGSSKEMYCSKGYNSYTVAEFLRPFEQTAKLCGMKYIPPFAVMGTDNLSDKELNNHVEKYGKLIDLLQEGLSIDDCDGQAFLNDIPKLKNP